MNFTPYNEKQLRRLHDKILYRATHNRPQDWDGPTLLAVMPQIGRMLRAIRREIIRRRQEVAA